MSPESPDSAGKIAGQMMRAARFAALATAGEDGHPFVSLVALAVDAEGAPLMLLSGLARHTRNLAGDARAALLLRDEAPDADPLAAARLTLVGRIDRVGSDEAEAARQVYLRNHPGAAAYSGFGDFALYRMTVDEAHLVAGFGRIESLGRDGLAAAFAPSRQAPRSKAKT